MATIGVDWLAGVLCSEGLDVVASAGPHDRVHGEANDAWDVRCHHPGCQDTSAESIATGGPDQASRVATPSSTEQPEPAEVNRQHRQ